MSNTPKIVLRLAAHFHRLGIAAERAYEEEVRDWYAKGDGRAPRWHVFVEGDEVYRANVGGQGHTFPECIHGASRWTDYDNICWGCEEGITPSDPQIALQRAKADFAEAQRRLTDVAMSVLVEPSVPQATKDALTEWALGVLPVVPPQPVRRLP